MARPEVTGKACYSVNELCVLTGMCRDSIYGAIRTGALPARKFGKRTLILASDLQRFLESLPVIGGEAGAAAGQKPGTAA